MTIKIKDKEIELKYSIRSMLMYENITEKTFSPQTMTDVITFMYCVIVSSSNDYSLKFDDFIEELDNNPEILKDFGEWLQSSATNNDTFKKN